MAQFAGAAPIGRSGKGSQGPLTRNCAPETASCKGKDSAGDWRQAHKRRPWYGAPSRYTSNRATKRATSLPW